MQDIIYFVEFINKDKIIEEELEEFEQEFKREEIVKYEYFILSKTCFFHFSFFSDFIYYFLTFL
jgi:hypothetical protein